MDDDPRLSHYVYIYMANRDKPLKFAFAVGETIEYLCIKVRMIFFLSAKQSRISILPCIFYYSSIQSVLISRKINTFLFLDMQCLQYKSFSKTFVRIAKLFFKTMVPMRSHTGRGLREVQIQLSLEIQAIQYGQTERDRFKCI